MSLMELLDRPIAFHRIFVKLTGSVTAALMLSQAFYWSKRTSDPDGWFYKTQAEWEDETGMGRYEQEGARKALRRLAFWEEKREGVPAKLFYRINLSSLEGLLTDLIAEKPQTSMGETTIPVCGKTTFKNDGKPHSFYIQRILTENTAETTAYEPLCAVSQTEDGCDFEQGGFIQNPSTENRQRLTENKSGLTLAETSPNQTSLHSPPQGSAVPPQSGLDLIFQIYSQDKPEHWAACKALNEKRRKVVRAFLREHKDRSVEVFQAALHFAAQDPFWSDPKKKFDFDTLFEKNRAVQFAERWEGGTGETREQRGERLAREAVQELMQERGYGFKAS